MIHLLGHMNTFARILTFGLLSGLLWSVGLFVISMMFGGSSAEKLLVVVAGIIAGVIMSAILAPLVTRVRVRASVILGLLSLPVGAFVFGYSFALMTRFTPNLKFGWHVMPLEPWAFGLRNALGCVSTWLAFGLFPLASVTTVLLRKYIMQGRRSDVA